MFPAYYCNNDNNNNDNLVECRIHLKRKKQTRTPPCRARSPLPPPYATAAITDADVAFTRCIRIAHTFVKYDHVKNRQTKRYTRRERSCLPWRRAQTVFFFLGTADAINGVKTSNMCTKKQKIKKIRVRLNVTTTKKQWKINEKKYL